MAANKGRRQKRPPPAFEAVKGGQFLGKEDGRIGEKQNRRRALPVPLHLRECIFNAKFETTVRNC